MVSKEQYSNLSCFEEFDIRCTMYGHELSDVAETCGISIVDNNDVQFHLIPTISGLIWFYEGKRIDPPEVWDGDFNLRDNDLMTLIGCPKKVNGNFYCSHNQLTSLVGAPTKVGGNFNCSYNKLTSLSGALSEVGGDFSCSLNKLTSLSGAPLKISGDLYCCNNAVVFSVEYARKMSKVKGDIFV